LNTNKVHLKENGINTELYTRLYLVRHGELVTSSEWRYVGQMDVDLNDTGKNQFKKLANRLKIEGIDKLLSSDLKRTVESAEIIGNEIGIANEPVSAFREINLGIWEGLTIDEIAERSPDDLKRRSDDIENFRVKQGESFSDVNIRVIPKLKEYISAYKGQRLLLVAHGGVNRIIIADALGLSVNNIVRFEQDYACLNIIDYYENGPVVRLLNQNSVTG